MYTLAQVRKKSKRENDESNRRLHFFASKFSIYFTWLFINFNLSPNAVTGIFFVTGLCSSVLFMSNNLILILIGYVLWRLHIIFDICDGDVARFTEKYSINGAYWDYMVHSVLYPLTYVSISTAMYYRFSDIVFLLVGIFGCIIVSQSLSVKNNYYRAMLFEGVKLNINKSSSKKSVIKSYFINLIMGFINFEGFLLTYILLNIVNFGVEYYLYFLIFYSLSFLSQAVAKFILFSKNGFYERRS
jgi:phosphatidylglycerophosphate synthase